MKKLTKSEIKKLSKADFKIWLEAETKRTKLINEIDNKMDKNKLLIHKKKLGDKFDFTKMSFKEFERFYNASKLGLLKIWLYEYEFVTFEDFFLIKYIQEILIPRVEKSEYFDEFLRQYKTEEEIKNEILEFLIPNFPAEIKSGNTKTTSNKDFFSAAYSISNHKFIHYNTKKRIDFIAFDLDFYNGKEAIKTFPTIESFKQHLITKLGKDLIPSLIIQTSKGYQFFYHLKVPVLTENKKAVKFLRDIKAGMIELLDLDKIASSKLYGVFRGPIKNPTEYTLKKDFQLKDFLKFSKKSNNINTFNNSLYGNSENVNHKSFREGNRNHYLFLRGLIFSNNKKDLTFEIIFNRILGINLKGNKPLQESEVKIIARSVFGYYKTDKINLKILIRKGIMGFEKPSNLSADEFKILVKERQKLSAERTNKIRDKDKNQKALEKAREINSIKQQSEMINKLQVAKDFLRKNHEKITKAAIQKKSKCDIRTVRKYFDLLN